MTNSTVKILLVEDDLNLARIMQLSLTRHDYYVDVFHRGDKAIEAFDAYSYDAVLLDVDLPDVSGFEVCNELREHSDVPIIMMSAYAIEEREVADGLYRGADEYLVKPFGLIEFHARLKNVLRRVARHRQVRDTHSYTDSYLDVNITERKVRISNRPVKLTPTEFKLLCMFIENADQPLPFGDLLQQVWGKEYQNEHNYPRIYVGKLRQKIEPDAKNPVYITSIYGVGYRFNSNPKIHITGEMRAVIPS